MLRRSYLLLYRKRLIASAVVSLLSAIVILLLTSADSFLDIGIFWHHVCACPPAPKDARTLADIFSFTSFVLPAILGISTGFVAVPPPSLQSHTRFLLTRPVPRFIHILQPLFLSALAITILPALSWLLLLGWLRLVHAPVLGHLLALVELIPSASKVGPTPSVLRVMGAFHLGRRIVASLSVGLSLYSVWASQRWLVLSSNLHLRTLSMLPFLLIYAPSLHAFGDRLLSSILLWMPKSASLAYLPSTQAIVLHFAFAAAVLYGSWRLLQRTEL